MQQGQYRECYKAAGMPENVNVVNAHYQSQIKST
jgi:hypothetical protein